ncbi:magnesium-dependent phosphatase 1-like [Bolinopsis microptera]|uniref:magnesium-dependent phosphatase 1-like n=1 Tax=Bolinopsis microptera TaxID=2820187 RepID=UPI003078E2C3
MATICCKIYRSDCFRKFKAYPFHKIRSNFSPTIRSFVRPVNTHPDMEEFPEQNRPGIVIFDMDYTVWPYWADVHLDPPFSVSNGVVKDSRNEKVKIYPDILKILNFCKHHDIPMAVASKSPETTMYKELMKLLDIHKYFVQFEIYRKSKENHMKVINEQQNIEFTDMIFFDDDFRNIESTRRIGVTAVHCPRLGVTWNMFLEALKKHSDCKQTNPKQRQLK